MKPRLWIRIALGYLAFSSAEIGLWALFAPKSFYDGFPGFGRAWISIDGPYNEHFIRDFGALNLALAAVFIMAAIAYTPTLLRTAAIAALLWGGPHFLYHAINTDGYATSDLVASLMGLSLFIILPIAILLTSRPGSEQASIR